MVSGKTKEAKSQEKTSENRSVDVIDVDINEGEDGFTCFFYPLSAPSGVHSVEKGIHLNTIAIQIPSGSTRDEFKVRVTDTWRKSAES